MQKESDASSTANAERRVFTVFIKNKALKILDDYSLQSGRKWQSICNEIIETLKLKVTESSPLLIRQDLESWAARKSTLGDEKFKFVFDFLTHPETLSRPEFFVAKDMLEHGVINRIGGAFADFFDGHKTSNFIHRYPSQEVISDNLIEDRMNQLEGCFIGNGDQADYCVSIERMHTKNFFICHFFFWPIISLGDTRDWEINRSSGFCTVGNHIRLHTKSVFVAETQEMYLVPVIDYDIQTETDKIDEIDIIVSALINEAIRHVQHQDYSLIQNELKNIDPIAHTIRLKRTKNAELREFIDEFRWNVM